MLTPADNARLHISGRSVFSAPISCRDGEYLNAWRRGKKLLITWKMTGYVMAIDSAEHLPVVWLDASNVTDNNDALPSLDSDTIDSKILRPLKLSNMFIEEFPLEVSERIRKSEQAAVLLSGINGIMHDLHTLVDHLYNAVEVLRNAKTGYEYRHVMDEVKTALEAIRNYVNKKDLGKEIFVETSIIGNIALNGGDIAAEDVMDKIFQIMHIGWQVNPRIQNNRINLLKDLA